jgi:uncharacterized membrane protein YphA (DoxX/SURF4 family)
MSKLIQPGRIIFAIGIIALSVVQFIKGEYIIGRPPALSWPAWAVTMPGKLIWAYLSASLLIIAGLAIIFNKKARLGAIIIGVVILVYSFLMRHLPAMSDWGNAYKSLALGGGAFIVAASFFKKEDTNSHNSFTNNNLILTGCIFLSLFLIICGILHFKFDDFVKDFIPAYIPLHAFWTYFCGIALLAGSIGLIFRSTRKWAALLSGIMILLWFVLLHIPRASYTPKDYTEWMGVCESFTFSGIFFVLAGISSKKNSVHIKT